MKVKYKIPVIQFEYGEIELTKEEEFYFTDGDEENALTGIGHRLDLFMAHDLKGAIDCDYAYIEEIKKKVTLDDVKGVD